MNKSEFLIDELYKKIEQLTETQKKVLKLLEENEKEALSENKNPENANR